MAKLRKIKEYEILVDGKVKRWRWTRWDADMAADELRRQNPDAEVKVRIVRTPVRPKTALSA